MLNKIFSLLIFVFVLLLISGQTLKAQKTLVGPHREISRDSILIYARTIMDSAQCRILVTVDESGKPQARTMAPFPPEEDWTIWLGTSPGSRKVKQIEHNPNVIVYYYETKGKSYVSIFGTAQLVNDETLKEKYWNPSWKIFYADREKDYILIEVKPEKMEICSFKYRLFWDEEGRPMELYFNFD